MRNNPIVEVENIHRSLKLISFHIFCKLRVSTRNLQKIKYTTTFLWRFRQTMWLRYMWFSYHHFGSP